MSSVWIPIAILAGIGLIGLVALLVVAVVVFLARRSGRNKQQ